MSTVHSIKAIIGLGNPGSQFANTRHNIGFRIVDALADQCNVSWQSKGNMQVATCALADRSYLLIKPQTFMNNSGDIMQALQKQGIRAENVVVVHDELELPYGQVKLKMGGSAKGHNGLKSLIAAWGPEFLRLRFGIGRPTDRAEVANFVLRPFSENDVHLHVEKAKQELINLLQKA